MGRKREPDWRRFERLIQQVFKRTPGARVKSDAVVRGKSGRSRKLELWVKYPFEIKFAEHFTVRLEIKIAVDCKDHAKPVGIKKIEEFLGQMSDVGAHAGIMVSTMGFDKGARARAKKEAVFLVDAPNDVLLLARGFKTPEFFLCQCCSDATAGSDGMPGVVDWHYGRPDGHEPSRGACNRCNAPHVMCPDCAEVVGFHEGEFGKWIECSGGCGRIYHVSYSHDGGGEDIETVGPMERRILEEAAKGVELPVATIAKLLRGTKWQYASAATDPIAQLRSRGWIEDTDSDQSLRLTEDGSEFAKETLPEVEGSMYGW